MENANEPDLEAVEVGLGDESSLKDMCLFCSKPSNPSESRKRGIKVCQVKQENFENTIRQLIQKRNDEWANEVHKRIGNHNLVSIEATYHQTCSTRFRTMKPRTPSESNKKIGRPQDQNRDAAFLKICAQMVNNEGEVFALSDLCDQMHQECDEKTTPYSRKYFKQRLLDHFGEDIVISQTTGKNDLVLFR